MARQYSVETPGPINVVTTNETALQVTPPVSSQSGAESVWIEGQLDMTFGASTTAVTVRVRRGNGIIGVTVGDVEIPTETAGNRAPIPYSVKDSPGEVANQLYTITVQQTAATANGTVNDVSASVTIGQP